MGGGGWGLRFVYNFCEFTYVFREPSPMCPVLRSLGSREIVCKKVAARPGSDRPRDPRRPGPRVMRIVFWETTLPGTVLLVVLARKSFGPSARVSNDPSEESL